MADKTLVCADCGADFVFTDREQAFYREKGFDNEPKRCPACRAAKKQSKRDGGGARKDMYPAICAGCGKETTVPFKPSGDKPVYCKDCYQNRR